MARLRTAIIKEAKAYPQTNYGAYVVRRVNDQLDKTRLSSLTPEKKEELGQKLEAELVQLKRMSKMASLVGSQDNFKTILDFKNIN